MVRIENLAGKLKPETVNKASRTIDLVWYTGATVPRLNGWTGEQYTLAFSMDPAHVKLGRLNAGAPLVDSHNTGTIQNVLGVVRKAWLNGKQGLATVEFSARPEVETIWKEVQAGILQNVSMSAVINATKDITPKGQKMRSLLAIDWEPQEISAVPVGADPGAKFLSAREAMQMPDDIQAFFARLKADRKDLATTGAAGTTGENFRLGLAKHRQRQREYFG